MKLLNSFKTSLKKLTPLLLMIVIMLMVLDLAPVVSAQFSGLENIGKQSGLNTNLAPRGTSGTGDEGINKLEALILTIVDIVKYAIYGLAIFFAFFQGFKLITAGKDIDTFSEEAKNNIKYSLMAIVIVFLADTLIRKVFFPDGGAVFENQGANIALYGKEGMKQIRGIYTAMSYVAGSLAILVIVISGVGLTLSAGAEESMTKHKNRILWALAGLLLVGIAEFVVKDVFFPDMGAKLPDISKGMLLVKKFTNFMSGFISTISFLLMLYAGFLYIAGGANEENLAKAKKAITAGIIGILLSLGAFALVTTFIKTDPKSAVVAPLGTPPPGISKPASLK